MRKGQIVQHFSTHWIVTAVNGDMVTLRSLKARQLRMDDITVPKSRVHKLDYERPRYRDRY